MTTPRRPRWRAVPRRLRVALLPLPAQAVSLALLAAVLGAALVSAPLVLASAAEGTWERERSRHPDAALGVALHSATAPPAGERSPARFARVGEFDAAVSDAARDAGLGTPTFQVRLRDPLSTTAGGDQGRAQVVFRTGWEGAVRLLAGEVTDDGVVVPQRLAESARVGPGDRLPVRSDEGVETSVPVTGVYAEPTAPLPAYWATQGALFLPRPSPVARDPLLPPPAALGRRDVVLSLAAEVEQDLLLEWSRPLAPGIDVDGARAVAERYEDLAVRLVGPASSVARLTASTGYERPTPASELAGALDAVDRTVELLRPSVRAVGTGAAAAALVLVGAWAAQRVRRRGDELRSLVIRGMSPLGAAGQAVREAAVPLGVGALAGAAGGRFVVAAGGPSPELAAGAVGNALRALAVGSAAALAVVAAVTAALVVRLDQVGKGPLTRALHRVPWLPVTAAVALATAVPVLRGGEPRSGIDVLTLVLPLLVAVVAGGAVTAALPLVGRRADTRLRRLPPTTYLALRRILAGRPAARLVVVTTALALGLVVYAGALGNSSTRTVAAKAAVSAGSDAVVPLVRRTEEPGPLPPGSTIVGTEEGATLVPGEVRTDLLVVEPEQVDDVLRWDDALAERPLDELLGALSGYDGDSVPALLAGPGAGDIGTGDELTLTFFAYYALPVEIVGHASAFPGQTSRTPALVLDRDRFVTALRAANRDPQQVLDQQVWSPGDVEPLLPALTAAGYAYNADAIVTRDDFAARPEVQAQAVSLGYLRAVALAAGLLGLLGIGMHALAQQHRRTVAAVLLSRMGMSRWSAATSTALEVGLLAGLGAVVAAAVALPTSALVTALLDPAPTLLPAPVFAAPWGSIAAVAAGVALATAGTGLLVARAAQRASAGEVLRDAA